jgi:putative membrane protein
LSLGGLELRRFSRAPLTRLALAGLMMLPLLYAGLYLWSFWDPAGHLSNMPVALVVEDKPARAGDQEIHAGADLAKELKNRKIFKWREVNAAEARAGVESGRYYMSLTIPANFSRHLASPSGDGPVENATLKVQLNDANNYIVGTIADTAFKEITAAAGNKAAKGYFDNIFVSFGTLHSKIKDAAEGAGKLATGAEKATDGADRLHNGLGTAAAGSKQLSSGLGTLKDGTSTLASGSKQVAAGVDKLNQTVDFYSGKALPVLRTHAGDIQKAAVAVGRTADEIARAAEWVPGLAAQAVRDAKKDRADLKAYLDKHPEIPLVVKVRLLLATERIIGVAVAVDNFVHTHLDGFRKVATDSRLIADASYKLAKEVPSLAGKIAKATEDVRRLNSGAAQVAGGAAKLNSGAQGAYQASQQLADGLNTLNTGAGTLENGLVTLADGSGTLASGLTDGYQQIPNYSDSEVDERAGVMSRPVRLDTSTENEAANYGTGFAPFFVPLSLWVGAMFAYMILKPVNARALAGTAPSWRVALAGWLPAVLIGAVQTLVVIVALKVGLGFSAVRWIGLIAFLWLAAAAFLAVVQWANAQFGPIGRVVALVLLMLQLTSAGGTYPIETSPAFFQKIQNLLPMPWAVKGMRHLVSGGDLTSVWQACGVFVIYIAGALFLTALAARSHRVWSVKRLHPVLTL